jgi:hypothetical protein
MNRWGRQYEQAGAQTHSPIQSEHVGWPKQPDANASGGVPTIIFEKWWARREERGFAHPTT